MLRCVSGFCSDTLRSLCGPGIAARNSFIYYIIMLIEFMEGFAPSPLEIAVFVALLVAFVGGLIWFAVASRRREDRRQRAVFQHRYEDLVESMNLSQSDRGLIEELSRYLRRPYAKYLLLQNHTVFDRCVESALSEGVVFEGDVAALRVRLGYAGKTSGTEPESSTEIPPGSGLVLLDAHDRSIPVRLVEHTPSSFRVRTDEDAPRLTSGSLVEVVYQNGSGIYRFESAVLANPPGEMHLLHTEQLERVQRRAYYRGEVRLPAYVKLARETRRPTKTQLVDIGGGGASFYAPDSRYQRGEQIELTFHPDSDAPLHLPGRIVRESKGGRIAHMCFGDLRPSTRDRVFEYLFRNQAASSSRSGST